MPDDHSPITLPPQGASAEEMLRSVLPLVARSSAESAKAATLAAAAINSNEQEIVSVRDALVRCTTSVEKLTTAVEGSIGSLAEEKKENGRWIRRLLTPELFAQIVLNALLILGAIFGVRAMIVPPTGSTPIPIEANEAGQP